MANQRPVRPKPVMISSVISRIWCRSQSSRSMRMYCGGGTITPPAPWIGSATTAATLAAPSRATISSIESIASRAASSGSPSPKPVDIGRESVEEARRGGPNRSQ